ncbi:hypothetical protein [Polyangium sp. y55x31]|uniref:hypothetical protein n=1 Tax=Polyangium sp. y55x31 TaxID=3042688 RepID=UPI0024830472|nr:hypothetical protein [Polyangium sp. y55x31]MDI1477085.1 hypothetical protein [Polyangium sp. y55x31]
MRSRSLLVLCILSLFGCGGSSSETPWPAEPEGPALGPAGETSPGELDDIRSAAPDAGGGGPGVEP